MAKIPKDSMLGAEKERIPLYKNALDDAGSIIIYEEGLVISYDGEKLKAPFTHVKSITKTRTMPLAKVEVNIEAYDLVGMKYDFYVTMNDHYYDALKRACSK